MGRECQQEVGPRKSAPIDIFIDLASQISRRGPSLCPVPNCLAKSHVSSLLEMWPPTFPLNHSLNQEQITKSFGAHPQERGLGRFEWLPIVHFTLAMDIAPHNPFDERLRMARVPASRTPSIGWCGRRDMKQAKGSVLFLRQMPACQRTGQWARDGRTPDSARPWPHPGQPRTLPFYWPSVR